MKPIEITLNASQQHALDLMQAFVNDDSARVFILTGYAGTGKTTLVRFFIRYLAEQQRMYKLLSTTGRAAKILANYTGKDTNTIHRLIYSYSGFNKDLSDTDEENITKDKVGQLYINFAPQQCDLDDNAMIYIIDESSMISDEPIANPVQAKFGSGKLLTELLDFDQRHGSKFVFIGDPAQLPPINSVHSPALDPDYFRQCFNIHPRTASLTEIMRQHGSLVEAAAEIRTLWAKAPLVKTIYGRTASVWGKLPIAKYPSICLMPDLKDMINNYIDTIRDKGYNEATFICQSNKDVMQISQEVRTRLGFIGEVQPGDLLLVQQNQLTTGLMNGDLVTVVSVNPKPARTMLVDTKYCAQRSELRFREITVRELFTKKEYTTLVIETLLNSGQSNLDADQQTGLFIDFIVRMKERNIKQKSKIFDEAMYRDPYLNALRCTYGYAITCHKAQGGEWEKVFVHVKRNITLNPTKNAYQWLYTAITRAKQTACLINDFFIVP